MKTRTAVFLSVEHDEAVSATAVAKAIRSLLNGHKIYTGKAGKRKEHKLADVKLDHIREK